MSLIVNKSDKIYVLWTFSDLLSATVEWGNQGAQPYFLMGKRILDF